MSGTKQKLGSEHVKKSISHLIREARICAGTKSEINGEFGVLGFSAMLTIFPVINSISEAILNDRNIERTISYFVREMGSSASWPIKSPSCSYTDESVIIRVRNGLVHAMSLPLRILLTKNNADAKTFINSNPNKYDCVIGIEQFIDQVEQTAYRIVNENSGIDFDPQGTQNFGPIDLAPPISGSAGNVTYSASRRSAE